MSDAKFEWEGDKIKHTVKEKIEKHSPKDILNGLKQVRGQVLQFEDQVKKMDANRKQLLLNIDSAKKRVKELEEFEERCLELQLESLKLLIAQIHEECKIKALASAEKVYAMDPNAYTLQHLENMKYVNYQKGLAIHPKVAKKICAGVISRSLFEYPIFSNPFKE